MLKAFKEKVAVLSATVVTTLLAAGPALAASGGTGMPWEGGIQKIANSFTGPVAMGVSVCGIAGSGMGLIFKGDEMGDFARIGCRVGLAGSTAMGAAQLATALFPAAAALW